MSLTPGSSDVASGGNVVAVSAMLASCAAFVGNDVCVKRMSAELPLGEIIFLRNVSATLLLLAFGLISRSLIRPDLRASRLIGWRVLGDLMATVLFLAGLLAMPIAEATALAQLTPLAMTAAAAIIFRERIGWRIWLATVIGLLGVLLTVQPGAEAFSPAAGLIILSVLFVVMRDVATRQLTSNVPTTTIAALSTGGAIAAGLALSPFETWLWPDARVAGLAALGGLLLAVAHVFVIIAMRTGDIAQVGPFRYALVPFALFAGWLFWDEWPDSVQMIGITLIMISGVYSLKRRGNSMMAWPR